MPSNKGDSYAYRNDVMLAFHEAGFVSLRRPREPKGVEPSMRTRGDVLGSPVTTGIRNGQTYDLAGAMAEVRREAAAEGNELYVAVQSRRGRPVEDSYVVTDLATWLKILVRLHPELVSLPV